MKLETLQSAMVDSMKAHDKTRKEVLSSMITAIKNKSIEMKCRDMQEMIGGEVSPHTRDFSHELGDTI